MRFITRIGVAAVALFALASGAAAQTKGLKVGDRAPTLTLLTLDGQRVNLADHVGKGPVLIEFWATWCPLCRQMEPTYRTLAERYGRDLQMFFIVVPTNQTPERARQYVERVKHPGTFLFDADGEAYKAFAAYHTSYVVVLDRQGKVLYSADGGEQDLNDVVRQAVGQ